MLEKHNLHIRDCNPFDYQVTYDMRCDILGLLDEDDDIFNKSIVNDDHNVVAMFNKELLIIDGERVEDTEDLSVDLLINISKVPNYINVGHRVTRKSEHHDKLVELGYRRLITLETWTNDIRLSQYVKNVTKER